MKSIISLHSGYLAQESPKSPEYQVFDGTFNLKSLINNPPTKVCSLLEISGWVKIAALNVNCSYLALIENTENAEVLHIFYLKNKRYKTFRKFLHPCSLLQFHDSCENLLFIGLKNCQLHLLDIENEMWTDLEGHKLSAAGVFQKQNSDTLLSWSMSEVLIWEWAVYTVSKRLRVNSNSIVKLAGEMNQDQKYFAAFNSGIVLQWDLKLPSCDETIIELPEGIDMEFNTFSLSSDMDWLVGGGSQPMVIIYSLKCARVIQVVHLSHSESFSEINDVVFLPTIHPMFSKSILIATAGNIMICDLTTSTIIKTLKSLQYSICNVCVSRDGLLLGITYNNGTAKVYALSSFLPIHSKKMEEIPENISEVSFKVLKSDDREIKAKKIQRQKIKSLLDSSKWTQILEEFEEFPEKYRKYIWTSLMQLPRNFSIFSCLLSKEENNHFPSLAMNFPRASPSLLLTFKNTISCLCYWTPALKSVDVLPDFLFPFIEFFEENPLLCFEVSVTLISNWFLLWIEEWPVSPKFLLSIIEQLICDSDPKLWVHFQKLKATSAHYIYPLIFTSFSKILCKSDWCKLWDHIFSKPPTFLFSTISAIILLLRQSLLLCKDNKMIKSIFLQENWLQVKEVIKKSKKLFMALDLDSLLREKIDRITFVPKGDLIPLSLKVHDIRHLFEKEKTEDATLNDRLSEVNISSCKNAATASKLNSNVWLKSSCEKVYTGCEEPKFDLYFVDHGEVMKRGNDCIKRVNNIRKKQVLKLT